ncbi:MAG: FAD-binding oxidoreductase [Hyphomicrobiales bacterium]|nr:FAD-binding oxidoreductase [Hyphomicrobiales bacterium]
MTENLIIGGGVYGAAVALELTERGAGAHLIEASHIGAGASAGPGKRGVRASGRDPREIPLIRQSREIWPSLHERLKVAPLFEHSGHIMLIERPEDMAEAEARAALQSAMGIPTEMVYGDAVRDYEPQVCDQVCAAMICPGDGVADHTATTHAYIAAAQAAGAVVDEGVTAARLVCEGSRATAIESADRRRYPVAGNLFILANAGVSALVADHIDLPVWNNAFQVLLSAPLDDVPIRHLVGHAHRTLSLKSEPGNRIMISGGYQGRWDYERQIGQTVASEVAANVADAVAAFPGLAGIEIEVADAGHLEAVSIDHVPIIDRLPGLDNVYFATGWTGHGWAIAPAIAALLATWALDGDAPSELAPFAMNRFTA